jgi:hypothetical protein
MLRLINSVYRYSFLSLSGLNRPHADDNCRRLHTAELKDALSVHHSILMRRTMRRVDNGCARDIASVGIQFVGRHTFVWSLVFAVQFVGHSLY